ncbi:hypothetical protein BDV97DRAFT_188699 [Delphinella strobiligena]|nr:hypothetical protein BDV97DRAFT_188699 [Delphinella strobiligena]
MIPKAIKTLNSIITQNKRYLIKCKHSTQEIEKKAKSKQKAQESILFRNPFSNHLTQTTLLKPPYSNHLTQPALLDPRRARFEGEMERQRQRRGKTEARGAETFCSRGNILLTRWVRGYLQYLRREEKRREEKRREAKDLARVGRVRFWYQMADRLTVRQGGKADLEFFTCLL